MGEDSISKARMIVDSFDTFCDDVITMMDEGCDYQEALELAEIKNKTSTHLHGMHARTN